MSKRLTMIIMVGALLCLPLASVVHADLLRVLADVTYFDPAKAYIGVTGFQVGAIGYLIDMDGRKIRTFNSGSGWTGRLEDNGNWSSGCSPTGRAQKWSVAGGFNSIREIAWDGSTIKLDFPTANSTDAGSHHDYKRMWNKTLQKYTYLVDCDQTMTTSEMLAASAVHPSTTDQGTDGLYEWLPNYNNGTATSATLIWKWRFADHLCQSVNPSGANYYSDVYLAPQKFDVNAITYGKNGPVTDWIHVNSIDYEDSTGYVCLNSREWNEWFIIDHDKTFVSGTDWSANFAASASSDGDFVYRAGSPVDYNAKPFTIDGVTYTHMQSYNSNGSVQHWGEHMINFNAPTLYTNGDEPPTRTGCPVMPNIGSLMLFDNHTTNEDMVGGYSGAVETNPHISGFANGAYVTSSSYVWQHLAGYRNGYNMATGALGNGYFHLSNQVIWRWRPKNMCFFSGHISGAERLPNGNVLLNAAEPSHMIELTQGDTSVMEPVDGSSPLLAWEFTYSPAGSPVQQNNNGSSYTFRAYRYDINHPSLKNHLQISSDYVISLKSGEATQAGYGATIQGGVPCRSVPCTYK